MNETKGRWGVEDAKHTPGPWYVIDGKIWRRPVEELYEYGGGVAGDKPLAFVNRGWDVGVGFPVLANARLIAAAPELLAALEDLICVCQNIQCEPPTLEVMRELDLEVIRARAAIAKAKGGAA